jgi:hypothetical protein
MSNGLMNKGSRAFKKRCEDSAEIMKMPEPPLPLGIPANVASVNGEGNVGRATLSALRAFFI